MHDDTLERTTNGRGPVAATTYAAIARLDAGAWFAPTWRGAGVPTLAAALALLAELDMGVNIEIKPCPGRDRETAEAVVGVVRSDPVPGRPPLLLSSFSRDSLAAARDSGPELPRGLLVWEYPADWTTAVTELGCVSVHCADEYLTPAWAAAIRGAGHGLAVYTVNDPARAHELRGWGVHCIITDRPDALLAAPEGGENRPGSSQRTH